MFGSILKEITKTIFYKNRFKQRFFYAFILRSFISIHKKAYKIIYRLLLHQPEIHFMDF